jgi:segregation and condensation protein A
VPGGLKPPTGPSDGSAPAASEAGAAPTFAVHLDNFDGPFDLLLQLIARHQFDITEVSLSTVTDDFIAHVKTLGVDADLDQTTAFLVVAATLLDLKIVRLLPSADLDDPEDLALLEARDLLFARLMQYRAFKQAAALLAERMEAESRRVPRTVGLDKRFTRALPEPAIGLDAVDFARLAARVLQPPEAPVVGLSHLHAPRVSVQEQAALLVDRLRRAPATTFRALVADSPDRLTTIARFLALLELYREGAVAFDQVVAMGELGIRWTGEDGREIAIADEYEGAEPEEQAPAESVTDDDVRALAAAAPGCRSTDDETQRDDRP